MRFSQETKDLFVKKNAIKKPKILVLYHSLYGHIHLMAEAVAQGVELGGGESIMRQVEGLIPQKLWNKPIKAAKKQMKHVPVADPESELVGIDGIIVGSPVHFGTMSAQMKVFWDQTSLALLKGSLNGKPAGVFCSSAMQHGGNEAALLSMIITLMHHGCFIVGLPFNDKMSNDGLRLVDEVSGGSFYGASTIAGPLGERLPSHNELMLARVLGQNVTVAAGKLMDK